MARRRAQGDGGMRRRPDGRWEGTVDLGWVDGRRRRKYVYGRTQAEVVQAMTLLRRQIQQGLPVLDERLTVGAYLDWWLREMVKHAVRPSTHASYEAKVRLYIKPALANVKLAHLTPAQVQRMLAHQLASGLSARTAQYTHAVLRRALGHAERLGLVARNVARLVETPRVTRKEVEPFTLDEAQELRRAASGGPLEGLITVAMSTGLRKGELLALRWPDVDLDRGTLRVRATLSTVNGEWHWGEPKSARSRRTLALSDVAAAALKRHRAFQAQQRLRAGDRWHNFDLVFASEVGTPMDGDNVVRMFKALCRRAGVPERRFHDLRHTCATFLLGQGVPTRVVMEVLGHSQMSLTTDTYQHVLPVMTRDAADRMDDLLGP
jgi:integrase